MSEQKTAERKEMGSRTFQSGIELIRFFLQGSKRYFACSILCAGLLSFFEMINPKIIEYTVDVIIGERKRTLSPLVERLLMAAGGISYLREHLWMVAASVLLVSAIAGTFRYLFKLFNSIGAEHLVIRMQNSLYEHIQRLPGKWYTENQTGEVLQKCTSDVETIKRFLSEQLTSLFRTIVLILAGIGFMAGIHVPMTIVAAAFIPVIIGYSLFFHNRIGEAFEKVDNEEGRLSALAQENIAGVRVVRAFGRERQEKEKFEKKNGIYTQMWIDLMKILSIFWASNDFISGFQVMTVTALGAWFCVKGDLTAGQYIAFVSYNAMLTWPVRSLGRVISELSQSGISTGRILAIMNAKEEQDGKNAHDCGSLLNKDIEFSHVTFGFTKDQKVLDDLSFCIRGGSTVGILGSTGSGKSTICSLLDRVYDLEEGNGEITIGGESIKDFKRRELRRHIGFVLQEPYLFSRTLEGNLTLGVKGATKEDIQRASRIASLEETIEGFPSGYQTFVGEKGVTLSGGQKQRTAIAQMLIKRPDIMIFDDSLSAVDPLTDAKIRKKIREETEQTTVILISHRISSLMHADQILVLDRGKLVESGTHEELIKVDGLYRRIYDLQIRMDETMEGGC